MQLWLTEDQKSQQYKRAKAGLLLAHWELKEKWGALEIGSGG